MKKPHYAPLYIVVIILALAFLATCKYDAYRVEKHRKEAAFLPIVEHSEIKELPFEILRSPFGTIAILSDIPDSNCKH